MKRIFVLTILIVLWGVMPTQGADVQINAEFHAAKGNSDKNAVSNGLFSSRYQNGQLAPMPDKPNAVSSQTDIAEKRVEPLLYKASSEETISFV